MGRKISAALTAICLIGLALQAQATEFTPFTQPRMSGIVAGPSDSNKHPAKDLISAGERHTCAVIPDGSIECWGDNSYGQLGHKGDSQNWQNLPEKVHGVFDAVRVAAGQNHTCALLKNRTLECWGANYFGQLGFGKTGGTAERNPVAVISNVIDVAAGGNHTCAVTTDGSVFCWGANISGQLGTGDNSDRNSPTRVQGISNAVSLTLGFDHTCAILEDGSVKCWGNNSYGQLGLGDFSARFFPTVVSAVQNASFLDAGTYHTCVVEESGLAKCWGYNAYGQLGIGNSKTPIATPRTLDGLINVAEISLGDSHTCATLVNKTVKCWGNNQVGQLGLGFYSTRVTSPTQVELLDSVVMAYSGSKHSCALREDGQIWCWGLNENLQFGSHTVADAQEAYRQLASAVSNVLYIVEISGSPDVGQRLSAEVRTAIEPLPDFSAEFQWFDNSGLLENVTSTIDLEVSDYGSRLGVGVSLSGPAFTLLEPYDPKVSLAAIANGPVLNTESEEFSLNPRALDAGGSNTCYLDRDLSLNCWGYLGASLGRPGLDASAIKVATTSSVRQFSTGGSFGCAVLISQGIECWGANHYGQLGTGDSNDRYTPTRVLEIDNAVSVATGGGHSCAVLLDGTIKCWGLNSSGQLGTGDSNNRYTATHLFQEMIDNAVAVSVGYQHSCAVLADGTIKCWGNNGVGQLGTGDSNNRYTPTRVLEIDHAVSVTAGDYHTCTALAVGTIKCWGDNSGGQLGEALNISPSTPIVVDGISGVAHLELGGQHSCAVSPSGAINCWGDNTQGQLGTGDSNDRSGPSNVLEISTAASVSAGNYHTCTVLLDGTAECWGWNAFGQLGTGDLLDRGIPAPVSGLTNAVSISAGWLHTCAVLANGTVECWGENDSGQLGTGDTTDHQIPIHAFGISDAVSVSAGLFHTCAVLTNGTIQCWGMNGAGQLGNGDTLNRVYPTTVLEITNAVSVSAGAYHTCALLADGTIQCWGGNTYGQLGTGDAISRNSPSPVLGISNSTLLASGDNHTCATQNGNLYCWGANHSGQLGVGDKDQRTSPAKVASLRRPVESLSLGSNHTCVAQVDNIVKCWGDGSEGQLGTGLRYSTSLDPLAMLLADPDGIPLQLRVSGAERAGGALRVTTDGSDWYASTQFAWMFEEDWLMQGPDSEFFLAVGPKLDLKPDFVGRSIVAVAISSPKVGNPFASSSPPIYIKQGLIFSLEPNLQGEFFVGETVSFEFDQSQLPPGAEFEISWQRAENESELATGVFYIIRESDLERYLIASLRVSAPGYEDYFWTSRWTYIDLRAFELVGTPTISGAVEVGSRITIDPGTWDEGVDFEVKWIRGAMPIADQTGLSYTLQDADADRRIWAVVTGKKDGYHDASVTTFETSSVKNALPMTLTPTPTISGAVAVGRTITVAAGTWDSGVTLAYHWSLGGVPISGATTSTLALTADHVGGQLTVSVTGTKAGYRTTTKTSAAATVAPGTLTLSPTPTIAGTAATGETLTATPGTWDAGVSLAYQWNRNGAAISGATAQNYLIAAGDSGTRLTVTVTGSKPGYNSISRTSNQTAAVLTGFTSAPIPTIRGTATVNQTLSVVTGTWNPTASFKYQWYRDGVAIARATSTSYKLTSTDNGKRITVAVTGSRTGYATTVRVSEPAGPVGTQFASAPTPVISGKVGIGSTVQVAPGAWSPRPDAFAYSWYRIPVGATPEATRNSQLLVSTSSTVAITDADYGYQLQVCVTGARSGYVTKTVCSTPTATVLGYALSLTPTPTISGTPAIGSQLIAISGSWDEGVTLSYQWSRSGTAIAGATSMNYTPSDADAGATLTVSVTGSKSGYTSETKTSVATAAIGKAFTAAPIPTVTGTAKEGQTLKVATGTWSPKASFTYQWYRDGVAITGATKASYKLVTADVGKRITIIVTGTASGYTSTARTSAQTAVVVRK